MSIDKTLRFTQSTKNTGNHNITALLRGGRLWLPLLTVQAVRL